VGDINTLLGLRLLKSFYCFYWSELDELTVPAEVERWSEIKNRYLELRGICKDCEEGKQKK
jgi:Fe2+ or Zn2+ uptake regulation protein